MRKKIIASTLVAAILLQSVSALPAAAEETTATQNYVYDDYQIAYEVTNSWGTTQMVALTLSNTGDNTIENWMLYFDPNGDVTSVSDAQQATTSDGITYFRNSGYNADVAPNASVTFNYTVDNCEVVPDSFTLCQTRVAKESGYDVQLKVNESWGDSFNGEIILQNNTDTSIEAWELTVDTNFTITEISNSWAATVTELEPYSYMLKGTYTGTVYANSSVSLGFIGVMDGEPEISDFSLTEVVVDECVINDAIKSYDDCEDWDELEDYDADGLPDKCETEYSCDPKNPDSDGDGLLDGYEIRTIGSDPTNANSIADVVIDGNYDNDQDYLNNAFEYSLGTDPMQTDSDFDGLLDGDEVNTYGTDPLNKDTDGDGLSDGDEIALDLNPLVADSNGDGVSDNEEMFSQSMTYNTEDSDVVIDSINVELEGTGYINSNTKIESIMNDNWMCSNIAGLIGEPYDISSTSKIATATITFNVDKSSLTDTAFGNLIILWYDEENQRFVEMETIHDAENSTLSTTVNHFSAYLIVDCTRWYSAWSENNYPTNGNTMHTAITIDCSSSMLNNDPNNYRVIAANGFVDVMSVADLASVILFSDGAHEEQELTNDKEALKNAIDKVTSAGTTNYEAALRYSIDSLNSQADASADDIIIFLSDGWPTEIVDGGGVVIPEDEFDYTLVDEAAAKGIRIYTIGLTENVNENILREMSNRTNGEYYYANTAENLIKYFLTINMGEKYDVITDTDGDGLPDLFETHGMPIANGDVMFSDPTIVDTDGDGLTDGEEVIIHIVDDAEEVKSAYNYMYSYIPEAFISDNGGIYFTVVANPENDDTDGDGIIDGDEVNNLTSDRRYDNLCPTKSDTIETLFPELTNPTGVNQENNAVYLQVEDNVITIKTRILFEGAYNDIATDLRTNEAQSKKIAERLGESYTYKDVVLDGLKHRWSGEYAGSIYDFYPGITATVSVEIEVLNVEPMGSTLHYTIIHCLSKQGRSGTDGGRKIGENKKITLYTHHEYKSDLEIVRYEGVAAHEFGHTLLLGDAYPGALDNSGYAPVSSESEYKEIYYNNRGFNSGLLGSGEIMYVNGDVLVNDIEMMLVGYTTGEWQRFVPSSLHSISEAIKEPQIYVRRKIDKYLYFTWDEENGFVSVDDN